MRISEILSNVNTFEKNNFLRIIESIISTKPSNYKAIERILNQIDGQIKNADNLSVEEIFNLVKIEYRTHILNEFSLATSQLDIISDILIRDGNSLMKREWLLKLYEKEVRELKSKGKKLMSIIDENEDDSRIRDYEIYKECVDTAYNNDKAINRECKITYEEQSILNTLIQVLDLSHEEVKLINISVIPFVKMDIDEIINYLVKSGIIFYSKRHHQVFVPDEIISIIREIRGREVSDKVFKRILRHLQDKHINLAARRYNIERTLSRDEKIKQIVKEGIGFSKLMLHSVHKPGTKKSEKRDFVNDLIERRLKITDYIKGASLEDKFNNLIEYLNQRDKEDNIRISIHGYDKLLNDLNDSIRGFSKIIRNEFELDEGVQFSAKDFLMHNLKPIDILSTITSDDIKKFCIDKGVSTRGNEMLNILEIYKDTQNLYLENYINISNRDINILKENNIDIKESELGIQYEELTKQIFKNMGLQVDEDLRKKINTAKDKIDILIKLEDQDVIIVECKTKKDKKFTTYSSASRQIKSYKNLVLGNGYRVTKTFIVAPEFSDEFINHCGLDYDLNLSLITSKSLIDIYNQFKESSLDEFPYKILLRDVLIDSERVMKALKK